MADENNSIKIKKFDGGIIKATRKTSWILCGNIPKTSDDLPFVDRDAEGGMCWWSVIPPNTDYWHAHQVLGRAYAFDLLDLINNPEAEFPKHIISHIVDSMARWRATVSPCAGEAMPHGFFEVLSEYITTGKVNR